MPPFVSTECPHCQKRNRFDLAELKKDGGYLYKGTIHRLVETDEELAVTCVNCGQRFKIAAPHELLEGGKKHGKIER